MFFAFDDRDILANAGPISTKIAKDVAEFAFESYRVFSGVIHLSSQSLPPNHLIAASGFCFVHGFIGSLEAFFKGFIEPNCGYACTKG